MMYRKGRYMRLNNPHASYTNIEYLTPDDEVFEGKYYVDAGDELDEISKLYTKSRLDARIDLLRAINAGTEEKINNKCGYYSSAAASFVVRFRPEEVQIRDPVRGDYFQLLSILSITDSALKRIGLIRHCPLDSKDQLFKAIQNIKAEIREESE